MNKKEQILGSLQKKREPKDYVHEYLAVRALLMNAGYRFTKGEYIATVGLSFKTFNKYLQQHEETVIAEMTAARKGNTDE